MNLKNKAGFTLLEVLVATSIMLMVCYVVLKMSSQVVNTWERSSKQLNNDNDLILALDIIGQDLETSLPYYWIYDLGCGRIRWCFYSYGKTKFPNAIVYEVGENGLYRYVQNTGKHYDVAEGLEEIGRFVTKKDIQKLSNRVSEAIKGLAVEFLYSNLDGKKEWTKQVPFLGTALGAEIQVIGADGERLTRRMILVGVSRL